MNAMMSVHVIFAGHFLICQVDLFLPFPMFLFPRTVPDKSSGHLLARAMELSLSPTTNVVEKGRTQERYEVLRVSISCSVGIVLFTLDMHLN